MYCRYTKFGFHIFSCFPLLCSIIRAMQSNSGKDEFLAQFQNIVDGVKQSKEKIERKLSEEKQRRDQLNASLQALIELQRKYVASVRQLSIECRKYEVLLAKCKS